MKKNSEYQATIDFLCRDLRSARRAPQLTSALSAWMGVGLPLCLIELSLLHFRFDLPAVVRTVAFNWHFIVLLILSTVCAFVTLKTAVPGKQFAPQYQRFIWVLSVLVVLPLVTVVSYERGQVFNEFDLHGIKCSLSLAGLALLPTLAFLALLRARFATVRPHFTGRYLGMSVGSLAASLLSFHCPVNGGWHLIVWHLIPIVFIAAATSYLAKKWLKF